MSRKDCISNRNFRIISSYLNSKVGHYDDLFEGIPYPTDLFNSPDDFFLNEDEWSTFESFHKVLRKGKDIVGEPYFYFLCGASSVNQQSWGRLEYFKRIFSSPNDVFKRIVFFNKTFNDTKDIEIIAPPEYSRALRKYRTIIKIQYHDDINVHEDYIGDPFFRGIISALPTLWELRPATVRQPLNPYDPEILFNEEPEFAPFDLKVKVEGDLLTIKHPLDGRRRSVGKKVLIEPERINGMEVFLGKYIDPSKKEAYKGNNHVDALLINETVEVDNRIILKAGEIFNAPYFILDVTYDGLSLLERFFHIFRISRKNLESDKGLIETITRLRETMAAKNKAYQDLESASAELKAAKNRVDEYAENLEKMVDERTHELKKAREKLLTLNRNLETKVDKQVKELERYNELRRYLSPKITDKILSSGDMLGAEPQRKTMTVLFSDIRNFSALTESLEPEEIFHLLDRYLAEMTRIIHCYDGTLNKIIGDGLLIFFGDPIPMEDHALRAVQMAIEMQRRVAELRDEWLKYGYKIGIGIGINTGYMTVGNIGSDNHKDYTVIGNQVNVAARLESLAKAGQILISQRTYSRVSDIIDVEEIGEIRVKGIQHLVMTYSVRV